MDYQIKLLAIATAVNIFFSFFVSRQERTPANILFALFTLLIGLWSFAVGFFIYTTNWELVLITANLFYLAPPLIATVFLYFSIIFTGGSFKKKYYLNLLPFFILIGIFIFDPHFLLDSIYSVDYGTYKDVVVNKAHYLYYSAYIFSYIIASYVVLLSAKRTIFGKRIEKQLDILIVGTFTSYVLATVFNLALPFTGNYQLIAFGPLFTLIMVFSIAYAIFKYHLFNVRLILVEMLLILLNLFLFLNIFTSYAQIDFVLNISVLIAVFILSFLLLRGIYKDIDDQEKIAVLAQNMSSANDRLRTMEEQKTEFVSIASHQLRTPLTVIKGYASMILEGTFGATSPTVREAVENLYKSSEKIVALVEDLLTVSRIEQGRITLIFEKVNLVNFAQDVISEMVTEIREAGIDMAFNAEGNKQFFVNLDPIKFRQALRHILDNAIKYTPEGGRIRVSIFRENLSGKAHIAISDTGIGMSQEQLKSIFEGFNLKAEMSNQKSVEVSREANDDVEQILARSSVSKNNTMGIGLYIAEEIIDAHRGTLSIESAGTGTGTTVIINLPCAQEKEN